MPTKDSEPRSPRRRVLPIYTWIGIGLTAFFASVALVSGGFWSMVLMCSLLMLGTALYGVVFGRRTWLLLPRRRSASAITAGASLLFLLVSAPVYAASVHPVEPKKVAVSVVHTSAPHASPTSTPTPTPTAVVTVQNVSTTSAIPFTATAVDDPSLAKGTTAAATAGVDGVLTTTYRVTFTDGVETARTQISQVVTTPPVTQVTHVGTYVAPAAPAAPPASGGGSNLHRGEFCAKAMHGQTVDGMTCKPVQSSGGRIYWRWE